MEGKIVSEHADSLEGAFPEESFVLEFVYLDFREEPIREEPTRKKALHVAGAVYGEAALCLFETEDLAKRYRRNQEHSEAAVRVLRLSAIDLVNYCEVASHYGTSHVVINPPVEVESYPIFTIESFKEDVQLHL